ncbi:RNA polymerase sigma factor [Flagellimonas sp.]|uniref:RNA polymerase sigma factor n=1 Tax=Flagellimonas sp. TaxID=2058762 RepID=UPI003B58BA5F
MDEEDLYRLIKQDDTGAMKELFHRHYRPLCIYIIQFTKSSQQAEDIVQDVFAKLWASRKDLTIISSLKSYLYRSAYNSYIDRFRENKKEGLLLKDLKHEALSSQAEEDNILLQRKIEKIKKLVDALPERCKEIILLSKEKGYKNREIAEELGISIKTVEAQIRIAFKKIRNGFEDDSLLFFLLSRW